MVQQYKSGIEILFQQKQSLFRPAVRVETVNGKYGFFDQIDSVTAKVKTTRHADIEVVDTPHKRRRVSMIDPYVADYIDKEDLVRVLNNPMNEYAMNHVMALNRAIDEEMISKALGTAYTGETGATSTSYDSNMTVAVNVDDDGSTATGLNVAKLRNAKRLLDENDVPLEDRFIAIAPHQLDELLSATEITSADYNTVKALVAGDLDTFLGFKFIMSNLLSADGSSYRECLYWHKSGLLLGMGSDIQVSIDPIPTKGNAILVQASMTMGGTRMSEKAVGKILCSES
jgi:hypothetical protein